jgi:hypothetical protein
MNKVFYIQYNVGRARYVVNYHNGIDAHKDGSPFFGIKIFNNKPLLNKCVTNLKAEGYEQQ